MDENKLAAIFMQVVKNSALLAIDPNRLMTIKDISKHYNIGEHTLREYIQNEGIPFRYKSNEKRCKAENRRGAAIVIRKKDFDAHLDKVFSNQFNHDSLFIKA